MARPLVTLSVELSDEVLLRLLSAGGVAPTSELRTKIGQSIANAGAEFLLGVITRNQSDDEEIATSLATVRAALRQVIAAVGREDDTAPLTNGAKSKTAAAIRQLLDVRQRVRGALRAEAKVAAGDKTGDPAVRAAAGAAAADRVERALAELVWLAELAAAAMRRQVAFEARDASARAVRRDRSPKVQGSVASVVYPPRVSGARTRRDEVVDRFLWRLWHSYVVAAATEKLPRVAVVAPTKSSGRQVRGELLPFCKACLEWIDTQIPADLKRSDPQLRRALAMTEEAIHERLRRVVDFGGMSRTGRQPRAKDPPAGN